MASRLINLNRRTFFVLSGSSNSLGKIVAIECCRRFAAGSLVLLIDNDVQQLHKLKAELDELLTDRDIKVFVAGSTAAKTTNNEVYRQQLLNCTDTLPGGDGVGTADAFELTFVLHNEGVAATSILTEPPESLAWQAYVAEHLYAPVALNQAFLEHVRSSLGSAEQLVVNVTASLPVLPHIYNNTLLCSCKKARNMYFRALAAEKRHQDVAVLSFAPGILESHMNVQGDANNNDIELEFLAECAKLPLLPRVKPLQSVLKLLNILEELSFVSGHDVDYYDTYVI